MSIDTIDVTLEEMTYEDGTVNEGIYLVLNGSRVKGVFNAYAFAFSDIRKRELLEVMTCGCGEAGCAGIFDGTKIKRRRYTVEWRDIDSRLPKRFYSFTRADYDAAIQKTFALMREVAERREARKANEEFCYDGILNFWTVEEYKDRLAWTRKWIARWKL